MINISGLKTTGKAKATRDQTRVANNFNTRIWKVESDGSLRAQAQFGLQKINAVINPVGGDLYF